MNSFELLQAYFKKETIEFTGDVRTEVYLENKQSLAPYLYYVYGDKFLNVYLGATLLQEKFYALQAELTKLFNENEIPHFYIKGSVLSRLYPDTTLRTRGDIDVMVREEDYERAAKLLSANGYSFQDECDHHKGFLKDNLEVELHRRLCDSIDKFYYYFKDPFSHTKLVSESLYELDINYHYVYLIYHLNRHLQTGEGLRSFLDFYYIEKKCNLDYEYINRELASLGFTKLHKSILACIYEITGEKLHGYEELQVMPLINSLLETGVHGHNSNKYLGEKRGIKKKGSKLKYLVTRVFMDKDVREILYPKMSKHYLLYPFMWCHRFFSLLFKQRKRLNDVLKLNVDDINEDIDFYSKFGVLE